MTFGATLVTATVCKNPEDNHHFYNFREILKT